jgi:hypothetical protein
MQAPRVETEKQLSARKTEQIAPSGMVDFPKIISGLQETEKRWKKL